MHRAVRSAALAATLAIALVGCASQGDAEAPSTATPAASPTATAEPSPTSSEADPTADGGAPATVDTSDWIEFATDDGEIAFRHPTDWTLETTTSEPIEGIGSSGARRMDTAELTAPNGQMLLGVYDNVDTGGACGVTEAGEPDVEALEVLATEPLESAPYPTAIATVALASSDGRWTFGLGLVDPSTLEYAETCYLYLITGSSEGGMYVGTTPGISIAGDDPLWTVDTLDDARAYMETDEYATLLEILRSVRLG